MKEEKLLEAMCLMQRKEALMRFSAYYADEWRNVGEYDDNFDAIGIEIMERIIEGFDALIKREIALCSKEIEEM